MKNELAPLAMLAALAGGAEAAPAGESTLTLGEVRVDSSSGRPLQTGSSVLSSVDVLGADKV